MGLKKNDVYIFLNKCQVKAVKSVEEKYAIELATAIESTLSESGNAALKKAITNAEFHLEKAVREREIIQKHVPGTHEYFVKVDFRRALFGIYYNVSDDFPKIKAVHAEWRERIKRVEDEYCRIRQMCTNKKTGDQARTALIALGFDVTWLNNLANLPVVINESEFKIDKDLVFPCGEAGVDETVVNS